MIFEQNVNMPACGQVRELVEAMHEKQVAKGCYVIREGKMVFVKCSFKIL